MWRFIENPFRYTKKNTLDNTFLKGSLGILIVSLLSILIISNNGFVNRFPLIENLISPDEMEEEKKRYWGNTITYIENLNVSEDAKNVIFMGNSHANDLSYAIIDNGFKEKITFLPTSSKCYNFGTPKKLEFKRDCESLKKNNLQHQAWKNANYIFLHDNWSVLDINNLNSFLEEIRNLTDAPIYVFGPKLTFRRPALKIVHSAKQQTVVGINNHSRDFSNLAERDYINNELIKYFKLMAKDRNIHFINVLKIQLEDDLQKIEIISPKTEKLLYFDSEHFTEEGASEFGERLKAKHPELFQLN